LNIQNHSAACVCDWTDGSLYWNSEKLFSHLQIRAVICANLTSEAVHDWKSIN